MAGGKPTAREAGVDVRRETHGQGSSVAGGCENAGREAVLISSVKPMDGQAVTTTDANPTGGNRKAEIREEMGAMTERKRRRQMRRGAGSGAEEYAHGEKGELTVRICGREKGMEVYEGVNFVRVRSSRYNLLIMKDYLPVLGRIEGDISFRNQESTYERENVQGFFMHKNNVFSLMLEDVKPADAAVGEGET